jgi:hypothetical protein
MKNLKLLGLGAILFFKIIILMTRSAIYILFRQNFDLFNLLRYNLFL